MAYVYKISAFQNPETGKIISIFSDIHNLGTFQQNKNQSEFFFNHIVLPAEKAKIKLDLLNEDKFSYFQTQKSHQGEESLAQPLEYEEKEPGLISFTYPYTSRYSKDYELEMFIDNRERQTEFSWIGSRLTYQMAQYQAESVHLESVDPRFPHFLWQVSPTIVSVQDLIEFPEIETHLNADQYYRLISENPSLKSEIEKIDQRLAWDRERLMLTKSQEEILKLLIDDWDLFSSAVDKMALLATMRSQSEKNHTFVFFGALHALVLEKSLHNLGYKRMFQTGQRTDYVQSIESIHKIFESRYEKRQGLDVYSRFADQMSSADIAVIPHLQDEIQSGMKKIYSFISGLN
jgi:hypothetical protein